MMLVRFSLLFHFKCLLHLCGRKHACFIQQAKTKYAVLFLPLFSFVQKEGATLSKRQNRLICHSQSLDNVCCSCPRNTASVI